MTVPCKAGKYRVRKAHLSRPSSYYSPIVIAWTMILSSPASSAFVLHPGATTVQSVHAHPRHDTRPGDADQRAQLHPMHIRWRPGIQIRITTALTSASSPSSVASATNKQTLSAGMIVGTVLGALAALRPHILYPPTLPPPPPPTITTITILDVSLSFQTLAPHT